MDISTLASGSSDAFKLAAILRDVIRKHNDGYVGKFCDRCGQPIPTCLCPIRSVTP